MKMEEFTVKVAEKLRAMYPTYDFRIIEQHKANNLCVTGLEVMEKYNNKINRCVPIFNLNSFYIDFTEDKIPFKEVMSSIQEAMDYVIDQTTKTCNEINVDMLSDFQNVKNRIFFRLLNHDKQTKEFLENIVSERFLDLVKIPYIDLGRYSTNVTKSILKSWGITEEELLATVTENMQHLYDSNIRTMSSFLNEIRDAIDENIDETCFTDDMLIISNKRECYGAAAIFDKVCLFDCANALCTSNLLIIPSSIHEVIVITKDLMSLSDVRAMVYETNRTEVSPEEFLSDNVYLYDAVTEEIVIA